MWREETVPQAMLVVVLLTFYKGIKKGSPDDFANYRPLALYTHVAKVIGAILAVGAAAGASL
eukprot:SAG11_NODE_7779_length_1097_cov_1.127255_2_plen_61_part_01